MASLILFGEDATILYLYFTGGIYLEIGILIGICVGIYILYLLVGLIKNPFFTYLGQIQTQAKLRYQFNKIKGIKFYIHLYAQCYHYELQFRTDSEGYSSTQTKKVVTHVAKKDLHPLSINDISGNVGQIRYTSDILFIHNIISYEFKDDQSRFCFQKQYQQFKRKNQKDKQQFYTYQLKIPNLKQRMGFYTKQNPINYVLVFIIFWFLGFIWPMSLYIQTMISIFGINYKKLLQFTN